MKRVLIAAGIIIILAFPTAGYMIYRHFHGIFGDLSRAKEVPADLQQARIVIGSSTFTKSIDFTTTGLGIITDIKPRSANSLLLVGHDSALTLAADNSIHDEIHFDRCFGPVTAADLGNGAFFCHSNLMSGPSLIAPNGATLWIYQRDSMGIGADDAVPGELGPNHMPVVAVGMNGDGGVRLLDASGKQLWRQPDGNVWHIEIAPTPNGNVIVHSNAGGCLTIRDLDGKILFRDDPEIYLAWFSLTPWADDPQPNHLIAADKDAFYIITLDGRTAARLPASLLQSISDQAHGIPVRFSTGPAFYAALVNHGLWNRSLLYIYDSTHTAVYTEILDQDCDALQTVSQPDGTQGLLVGCNNKLLRYASAAHPS